MWTFSHFLDVITHANAAYPQRDYSIRYCSKRLPLSLAIITLVSTWMLQLKVQMGVVSGRESAIWGKEAAGLSLTKL